MNTRRNTTSGNSSSTCGSGFIRFDGLRGGNFSGNSSSRLVQSCILFYHTHIKMTSFIRT